MNSLIQELETKYDIRVRDVSDRIEKGFLSENHRIETEGGDYFLKKYRFEEESRIKGIHFVKHYFSERGIPVILPLETKSKETYFKKGSSFYTLFPYVDGIQPNRGSLTDVQTVSLAKMLGHMHALGKRATFETKEYFNPWVKEEALETITVLEEEIAKIVQKTEFDELAHEVVQFKKGLVLKNSIQFDDLGVTSDTLVHGDYSDQNVFFDTSGEVLRVFDFEKVGFEPRTYELFKSGMYSFFDPASEKESIRKLTLYLDAYLEINHIDTAELESGLQVFYLKQVHSFWVEKEHYLKGSLRVDDFLREGYERLVFLSEHVDNMIDQLL